MPFLTETIYRGAFRSTEHLGPDSIHMTNWPSMDEKWTNKRLEEDMRIVQHITDAVASARQSKKIKLRQPVSTILIVADKPTVRRTLGSLRELLLQQANAKGVKLVSLSDEERLKKLIVEPNFKALGPVFRGDANKIAEKIRSLDGRQLMRAFKEEGRAKTFVLLRPDQPRPATGLEEDWKIEGDNFHMGISRQP